MTVYKGLVKVSTLEGKPTYLDITKEVEDIVRESGVKEGIVTVISCHTTCAVFSEEYDHDHTPTGDTFLQADLSDGLNRIFPEQHDGALHDVVLTGKAVSIQEVGNFMADSRGGCDTGTTSDNDLLHLLSPFVNKRCSHSTTSAGARTCFAIGQYAKRRRRKAIEKASAYSPITQTLILRLRSRVRSKSTKKMLARPLS